MIVPKCAPSTARPWSRRRADSSKPDRSTTEWVEVLSEESLRRFVKLTKQGT